MKKAKALKSAKNLIKKMKRGKWSYEVWNPYKYGDTWEYMIKNEFCNISYNSYRKNYQIDMVDYLGNYKSTIFCNDPNVGYEKVICRAKNFIERLINEM